jgi:hypothetical protein
LKKTEDFMSFEFGSEYFLAFFGQMEEIFIEICGQNLVAIRK